MDLNDNSKKRGGGSQISFSLEVTLAITGFGLYMYELRTSVVHGMKNVRGKK